MKWHQLDDGRGYGSLHITEDDGLMVITTPICDTEAEAQLIMSQKVRAATSS